MGEKISRDDQIQDVLVILRILVVTARNFVRVKCSPCWWTEKCGGLMWSCCFRNTKRKAGDKKRKYHLVF